nr:MAG TPA: hypothetical protein [Caudoviricetes sp.]
MPALYCKLSRSLYIICGCALIRRFIFYSAVRSKVYSLDQFVRMFSQSHEKVIDFIVYVIQYFVVASFFVKKYCSTTKKWFTVDFVGWYMLNDPFCYSVFSAWIF